MNVRKLLLTLAAVLGLGVAGTVPVMAQVGGSSQGENCASGTLLVSADEADDLEDDGGDDDGLLGLGLLGGNDEDNSDDGDDDGLLGLGLLGGNDEDNSDDGDDDGLLGLGLLGGNDEDNSDDGDSDDLQTRQTSDADAALGVCVDDLPRSEHDGSDDEGDDEGLLGLGDLFGDGDESDN